MIRLEPEERPHTFGGPDGRTVRSLDNLRIANRRFGGIRSVVDPLGALLAARRGGVVRVLDVGCGSADIVRALTLRARALGVRLWAVGVDFDPVVVDLARAACREWPEIEILRADARRLPFADKTFDYVIASMLLHYFGLGEAERLLDSWRCLATSSVIVSDVERHWAPYFATRVLGRISSNPLFAAGHAETIRRGFTAGELMRIGSQAGFVQMRISRHFPYRLCFQGQV
jgi:ubiquinone/menaquinone biosynthesis C-methylase UbiE